LPNLVIAGVTKAGTTSLFRYLGQHPDIGAADEKELDHYAPMVHGGQPPPIEEYARHFAAVADAPWRLEASPRYFIGGPALVQRLRDDLGTPKVLIALREPVSRMWSSYTYKRSKSRLPAGMTFADFYDECRRVADDRSERDPDDAGYRTLATGVYADFLPDWFDVLGSGVRVVFFDDLAAHPQQTVTELCTWLGLDAAPVAGFDLDVRNATYQPRSAALRTTAQRANSRLKRLVPEDSPVNQTLRRAYQRINSRPLAERFTDADRERVAAFYAPTLPPLRALLSTAGHAKLPEWLAT
jgi:Sulfotransferase domain